MAGKNFTYQNRSFDLSLVKDGNKLQRVVLNDGGLEFPFPNYEKASEFLADEYGGSKDAALAILNETESLEGLEVSGTPGTVAPSKEKGSKPKKEKKEKAPKEPKEKAPKPEPVVKSFELAGKVVEKKIQVKTILPDQKAEAVEDINLDEQFALHIDIFSKKNRTCVLYVKNAEAVVGEGKNVEKDRAIKTITNYPASVGEKIMENVSLMDAIYAFAERTGMSFPQADKFIKIKRGLLPEVEKKEKKEKKVEEPKNETTTPAEGGTEQA